MIAEALLGIGAAVALYQVGKRAWPAANDNGAVPSGSASKRLSAKYAPGNEEPGPLSGEWATYLGARPELRGAPANTILAVSGLEKRSDEFRARLLDMAEEMGVPVDTLAVVMSCESRIDPRALNPLPAAGLIQLTTGANLPGFTSKDKIREVAASWSAERQLEEIVRPYLARFGIKEPPTPGKFYLMNFLPKFANAGDQEIMGRKGETGPDGKPTFSAKVYDWNPGFDKTKKGVIVVADVKDNARTCARSAKGRRMTVDGKVIEARAGKGVGAVVAKEAAKAAAVVPTPEGARPLGSNANGLLLAAVRSGEVVVPEWRTVRVGDLEVEVMADALRAPVSIAVTEKDLQDENWRLGLGFFGYDKVGVITQPLRLPVTYRDTIAIAKTLGAVAPTKEIWDATWEQAQIKIPPAPLVAGERMASVGYSLMMNIAIDAMIQQAGGGPGRIVRDVGKGWIIHPRLVEMGAVNYGWIDPETKKPIQSVGGKHNAEHTDYSQVCLLVRRQARRNGQTVDLLDAFEQQGISRRFLDAYR